MQTPAKTILLPVDGSKNSFKSLDYLHLMFGEDPNLNLQLVYVLPSLPPLFADAPLSDKQLQTKLKEVQEKNREQGQKVIDKALKRTKKMFFAKEQVKAEYLTARGTTAQDICQLANRRRVDALLISRRGLTDLQSFFMGSVTRGLLDCRPFCPVWVCGRKNLSQTVLMAMDNSENALSAVEHVGAMLADTQCRITLFHAMRHLNKFIPAEVLNEPSELTDLWVDRLSDSIRPAMKKGRDILLKAGLQEEQINEKITQGSRSAAHDIITEATENHYGTIVLAHRSQKSATGALFGSVTAKVLNSVGKIAVWVV
ncbi:MAG: universal stress protein [Desulfobacterales bacterium]|jgi:nucleotide-binding universal stress UspA family protein